MARAQKVNETTDTRRQKRLTLRRLLDANEEIWVRNNSAHILGHQACNVVFQVGKPPMVDLVTVPPGNDPVCLTDQVDPESLRNCMDLFKLINKSALLVLDPDEANTYYEQHQERKRVMEEKISKLTAKTPVVPQAPVSKHAQTTKTMHPQIGDICLKARHAAITEHEALERVMEQAESLSEDDLNYLANNGHYAGLKRWAKERLNSLLDPVEAALKS